MFKKKVGLVLGGGGAKGFAHIGVLKFLEENKINLDYVAGTSIGALIGALHCLGYSAEEIEDLARKTEFKKLIDLALLKKGLIKGEKIENYLKKLFGGKKFSDLKKPLYIVAADIKNLKEIIFNKGDLIKAVRASISIPGIFIPVSNKDRILIDGGFLNNLPINALESEKPDCIIAVNLEGTKIIQRTYETAVPENDSSKIPNIFNTLLRSYDIMSMVLLKNNLEHRKNTLIISPDMKDIKIQSFDRIDDGIKAGYISAKANYKEINVLTGKENVFNKIINIFNQSPS